MSGAAGRIISCREGAPPPGARGLRGRACLYPAGAEEAEGAPCAAGEDPQELGEHALAEGPAGLRLEADEILARRGGM